MPQILDPAKNFAVANVLTGYAAGINTIVLQSGLGALFPDPSTEGAFNLVYWNATDYPNPSDDTAKEIIRVTARSTDTFTVTRAQEGTSDVAHNTVGKQYKVALGWTKKMRDDVEAEFQDIVNYPQTIPASSSVTLVYSDDATLYTANGTNNLYLCYKSPTRYVYRAGVRQIADATSFGSGTVSANTLNSAIIGSYIYVSFYDSTSSTHKMYRILKSADISAASSWTLLTLSGSNMTIAGMRFVGYDGTSFWFADQTNLTFVLGTLSGTTITRTTAVTVTGSNYLQSSRVNSGGIWASFSGTPTLKFASLAGALVNTKIMYTGSVFLLNGRTYLSSTDNNFYLQDDL